MSRIFISYKRVDKDKVFKIKDQIESALGEKCWIDLDGIESDAVFASKIIRAINKCEVFLFMYSNAHKDITDYENDWTIRELNFAHIQRKRIVFINIDGSKLTDWFKFHFGTKQQIEASSKMAIKHLCSDLGNWLDQEVKRTKVDNRKLIEKIITNKITLGAIIGLIEIVVSGIVISFNFSSLTITVNDVSFNMIKVKGGTFTMGATREMEDPDSDEKPTHQVTLSTYYIGETQVTQALWKTVMGSNPSSFKGNNLPVESVSWNDCQDFIKKLNQKTGKKFRLPTEAEWEFAARGGNKSQHSQYSGSTFLDEVAWYKDNSEDKTQPVKTKKANEIGIYDMTGNVWEWCQDWYDDYNNNAQINPTGPNSGSAHIIRGGCWYEDLEYCHYSCRDSSSPDDRDEGIGLRLVLSE